MLSIFLNLLPLPKFLVITNSEYFIVAELIKRGKDQNFCIHQHKATYYLVGRGKGKMKGREEKITEEEDGE